jgi:hypothetical protein
MNYKHGKAKSRIWGVWRAMKSRCQNPNDAAYSNYGGRGIAVCDQWNDFANFLADMGEPAKGQTLERDNNELGYSLSNCRWADRFEQGRNKRNNVLLTIDGETHALSVWAERSGLKYSTVHWRVMQGWPPEAAVRTPLVTVRKGIPRGEKIHAFGAERGVKFRELELVS